jgi:tetratricopeptide (TPR) repeat protein
MLRAYSELSRTTRDPRIVRRAAELALQARRPEYALEAAKLWVEIDPESSAARQMMAGIYVGLNRFDEAVPHVAKLLTFEAANLPTALLRLNRLFARAPEKAPVRASVDALTEPYLTYPEAWFARSEAASLAGDTPAALAAIDRALALRPSWEAAVLQKVQLLHPADPKAALEVMRAFVAANPAGRDVRLNYARALTGDRQYAEARRQFELLQRDFPDNLDVLYAVAVLSMQLGDFDSALPTLQRLLDKGYSDANQVRLYLGQINEEKKRYDEAAGWYYSVTPGEHYLSAQVRAASVLATQGRLDDARKSLQNAAAATRRERLQLVLAESQLLRDAGKVEEAYALLDKALEREPEDLDLLYETALMAERAGRAEVSETHLRKLIAKKPDHAHAYNALGYSLADRNVRLDEAQSLIEKALQLAPGDPFILDSMGWVLFRRGDHTGALKYLKEAMAVRPDPEIAAHLGEVMWAMGQRDEAKRVWREAVAAFPGSEPLNQTIKRFIP